MTEPKAPLNTTKFWLQALMILAIVMLITMLLGFGIGFISGLANHSGDYAKATATGWKAAIMLAAAVAAIGFGSWSLKRSKVPAWFESLGAFAIGFAVMNGVKAYLDGERDKLLGEIGLGFFMGACVGLGIYLMRKKGIVPSPNAKNSSK